MIRVKDTFINKNDIRVIRFEDTEMGRFLLVEYAFDQEHPTRINVVDFGEYEDLAFTICRVLDGNEVA